MFFINFYRILKLKKKNNKKSGCVWVDMHMIRKLKIVLRIYRPFSTCSMHFLVLGLKYPALHLLMSSVLFWTQTINAAVHCLFGTKFIPSGNPLQEGNRTGHGEQEEFFGSQILASYSPLKSLNQIEKHIA